MAGLLVNDKWSLPLRTLSEKSILIQSYDQISMSSSLTIDALSDDTLREFQRYLLKPEDANSPLALIHIIKALDFFNCPKDISEVCHILASYLENASNDELEKVHLLIQEIW
jgi:hypothetical protein